jgi:hypothetical protein
MPILSYYARENKILLLNTLHFCMTRKFLFCATQLPRKFYALFNFDPAMLWQEHNTSNTHYHTLRVLVRI